MCDPVLKVSGLSESLSDQNLTLLVPSSAAVGKMSSEDINFWTMQGNLPSLIRFHINWYFSLGSSSSPNVQLCLQKSHDPGSSSNIQPQKRDLSDLPAQDNTSCFSYR